MKKILYIIVFSIALTTLIGCNEYEMIKYNLSTRAYFVDSGVKTYNFGTALTATIRDSVEVQLQGTIPTSETKISLKFIDEDGEPMPSIEFEEKTLIIPAGEYKKMFYFSVSPPEKIKTNYKGNIVIDIENSDVEKGVIDYSRKLVTVFNDFEYSWEALKISESDWNAYFTPLIGAPSEIKIKFMLQTSTFKAYYPNGLPDALSDIKSGYDSWFKSQMVNQLNRYNKSNPDNPLKDENGELVNFDPK